MRPRGGLRRSCRWPERERILRILEVRPAISVRKLRDALAAEGLVFDATTVQRFLKRHGLERDPRLTRLRRKLWTDRWERDDAVPDSG